MKDGAKKELTLADLASPRPKEGGAMFRVMRACRNIWHKLLPRNMPRRVKRGGIHYFIRNRKVGGGILSNGHWEPRQVVYFFNETRRRGAEIFFDIGAHFGFYSMLAAKTGDFASIHSFEPQPKMYLDLVENIRANNFGSLVSPHNLAISETDGEVLMVGGIVQKAANAEDAGMAVQAAALDSKFNYEGRNIAMKIDVDTHEIAALKGMPNLLSRNRVFLQVEIGDMACYDYLVARGFRCIHHISQDFYFVNEH